MDYTREELEEIIDKYGDMVYRLAFSYTKNKEDADDISQEVFIKFIQNAYKFKKIDDGYLKAWLIRVTINRCKDFLASYWNRNIIALSDDITILMEEKSEVYEAVINLPEKYKIVIYLYYYEDYSVKEIAAILKRSQGTVKWQLSKARQLLKEQLEKEGLYVSGHIQGSK